MNGDERFSAAARLYAEHADVVEQMRKEFEASVAAFLDALRELVSGQFSEGSLHERQTRGYRYWWCADDTANYDTHAHLWVDTRKPTLVREGRLELYASAPAATADELKRYAALATSERSTSAWAPGVPRPGTGGPYSLFSVTIRQVDTQPLEIIAGAVGKVIQYLYETERASKGMQGGGV